MSVPSVKVRAPPPPKLFPIGVTEYSSSPFTPANEPVQTPGDHVACASER